MVFRIKSGKGFNNEGEVYETEIVERKLNGYKVINPDKEITFITFDDIEIIELTEQEKNLPITW